jgi:hypothetical protein
VRWRRTVAWTPGELDWWVPVLFLVGATLFALGSFPAYAQLVDPRVVGVTFVVGAVFFTSAATGQLGQASGGPRVWAPRSRDRLWWAALVQLAGTLLFNVNTIDAMTTTFTVQQENRLVWAPDFFGSIAFLVASHLAWLATCGRLWLVRRDDPDWWSAALNYVGSIWFMASALAAFTLETTGEPVNLALVNSGTFLGAVCFWLGAWVLLPAPRAAPAG